MAGLLFAYDIARAADIEILGCDGKSRPKAVEAAQNPQALLGGGRQLQPWLGREISIGAGLGAPHPAPDLVKLGQTEHIGAVNDHRVGGRNIDARFHDGRGQKHIVFAVVKGIHPFIKFACRHLAMGDHNADLGHLIAQERLDLGQVFDPGNDKEGLAAAVMLAQQRLAQCDRVELGHIGADRKPVDRRCADHRQIAHPRQRHLQGARNGRGR